MTRTRPVAVTPSRGARVVGGSRLGRLGRFVVLGLLVGCALVAVGLARQALSVPLGGWSPPVFDPALVVAHVNDEPVVWASVAERFDAAAVMGSAPAADADAWRARVRTTLDSIVDDMLTRQWVEAQGYVATGAMIDAEVAKVEARYGGPEALAAAMAGMQVTMPQLRETQRRGLYLQTLIDLVVPATDADIDAYLAQPGTDGLTRAEAAARVRAERAADVVGPFLAELRTRSAIHLVGVDGL